MIVDLSIRELRDAVASREISAEETVTAYISRLREQDSSLGAFNEVFFTEAVEEARRSDERRRGGDAHPCLDGVPLAVKDNICTVEGHTTCSSKILTDFRSPYEATVISRLKEAGAIILGKTNMDEFAMGSSTEMSSFRQTVNPWDPERVPGGSSGGSAAAVSAKQCLGALGSDTGGSIRQPAAFCGVVGLKPTYGLVSRYGLIAYGSSLDQIGTLTRDVADCAEVTRVIAGHDPLDSTSTERKIPDYGRSLNDPFEHIRIGLPQEFLSESLDPDIRRCVVRAAEVFRSTGAEIRDVSLPHSRIDVEDDSISSYAVSCYYIIAMAEASSNLSRYDGVHFGHRTSKIPADIKELYSRSRSEGFGDEVKRRILLGTYTLSSGYYDAYYLKALKVRRLIKEDFDRVFRSCDILVCPVTPTTAFRLGEKTEDPLKMYLEDIYTTSVNLAGLPGLSLPCGLAKDGLPVGMQLVGPPFSEELLLRAGRMFEALSGFSHLDPREREENIRKEEILNEFSSGSAHA